MICPNGSSVEAPPDLGVSCEEGRTSEPGLMNDESTMGMMELCRGVGLLVMSKLVLIITTVTSF